VASLAAALLWHGCQRKLELGFEPVDGGEPDAAADAGAPDGSAGDDDGGAAD
jgi:hypothetical protein